MGILNYDMVEGVKQGPEGEKGGGEKISVTEAKDTGGTPIGDYMNSLKGQKDDVAPTAISSSFGDPNAGLHKEASGMVGLQHFAAGKIDKRFYGHYLPEHFKKTTIIKTTGRVR